ncbi:EAL domain-containing protein [Variovorax sp. ZT4R33]|uniref:EAL domain-containing protein n=1 Tax=Variovorax sp. ZT4R33 TaxID=3443743 RepID=UPI003F4855E3
MNEQPTGDAGALALPELHPVFQPIVDLRAGEIVGYEALIRGPEGTPLHGPLALLAWADAHACLTSFELRCVQTILAQWRLTPAPGQLFINLSADALVEAMTKEEDSPTWFEAQMALHNTVAGAIIVELTESAGRGPAEALGQAVQRLRTTGARLALDDFGEGHSNLRRWTDLQPDFVKIDKSFVQGIAVQPQRAELVRMAVGLAQAFGTVLVAEGVEGPHDMGVLRELGVDLGQGYWFGRPQRVLQTEVPYLVSKAIDDRRVPVVPHPTHQGQPAALRGLAVIDAPALHPSTALDEVARIFQVHAELHALPVVDGGRPVALINRQSFMNDYARLYFREVHGRRPCLSYGNQAPRIVELGDSVERLLGILTSEDQAYLREGFVVTENSRYVGLGTGDQLVRSVTEARVEAARHANPLTFLPGNIPTSLHIQRLLDGRAGFVACYADLNNFKVFNDQFGYSRGDEMIRLLAQLAVSHADPYMDFVGHIGGDDFLILFQSSDWQQRCTNLIEAFNLAARSLYDDAAQRAGGVQAEDRYGVRRFTPLTSLSIGAVRVAPSASQDAEDIASEAAHAKHAAKQEPRGFSVRG